MRTFAAPFENGFTKSSLKRLITVQEASTEKKYNLSRSVNSFERIKKCQRQAKNYILLYNEEFDPGSG